MSVDVPDELRYLESHEWIRTDDGTGRVGITAFAQDELGDVVFVELPEVGDAVSQGDQFGVIESIKAVSDLYAPASGSVVATNEELFDRPELVNDDPYGEGWMIELDLDERAELDTLMGPEAYKEQIA